MIIKTPSSLIEGNAEDWGQHISSQRCCSLGDCAGCRQKVIAFSVTERRGGMNSIAVSSSGGPGFVFRPKFVLVASGST
jgi:hypothetical protein